MSLCLINQAPHHKDVRGSRGKAPPFLTSALDGGEWSASCPSHFCKYENVHIEQSYHLVICMWEVRGTVNSKPGLFQNSMNR
jgi:hypothetical protein